jgi:DNA mismatch repair protein MutL
MPKIHKLSPHEAQKIAAGEVVERPANIVKELIENAIDAGATQITVYLEDAGKKLIRIVDNGCGMSPEDAQLCFEHHATSKITSVEDLNAINTFGFRGEALSSIASIAQVTLITNEHSQQAAIKLQLDQGVITEQSQTSFNQGTDISIQNIFYNVPARKKFLKTSETELRQIQLLIQAFCLDYLNIHFKLISADKQLLNCPPTDILSERITQLWDHSFASHILTIEPLKVDGFTIYGAISNHHFARYDRSAMFFFVNKRWVKQQKLSSALLKGYLNVLQPARYPAACIFIEVDPAQVDINIHPRKEEVLFLHPRKIETALQNAVKKALEQNLSKQLKKAINFASATQVIHEPYSAFSGLQFEPMPQTLPISKMPYNKALSFNNMQTADSSSKIQEMQTNIMTPQAQKDSTIDQQEDSFDRATDLDKDEHYTLIGQLHKTYILLEKETGLYLIDQHAAHERILYELFSKKFEQIATVKLLFAQTITLTPQAISLIEPYLEIFAANGIDIGVMGENQLIIQATPVYVKNQSLEDVVQSVLGWISENQHASKEQLFKTLNEKIHAQMACKAAVKAGDVLNNEQIEQLLEDLKKTDNKFTCPHGRPTGWLLSKYEIEKKFKRKL